MFSKKSIGLSILAVCSFIFMMNIVTSCQIGLGASVDTEAPTLKITYPPSSAVIKGSFTFAGTCDDDLGVTAIAVTVTNTESSKTWSYDAEVDNKNWHVLNMNEADASAASGYKFPDGKYEISVVASDAAGHTSGTSSRSFEIDNTAPLFVIKGPGSKNINSPTAYGSVFTITGTIADDHAPIASMKVTVYDENKNIVDEVNAPYKFTNIETSGGTSVTIARYSNTETGDVYAHYKSIYGDNSKAGAKKYYCQVQLTDTAKEYTNPEEKSNTTTGNSTTTVYRNDDVYKTYLSAAGKNLQVSDIKKIVNGTFTGTTTNGGTLSSEEQDKVRAAFKLYKDATTPDAQGIELTAFSLNADASPRYSVGGLKFNTVTETTNLNEGVYNIGDNLYGASYKINITETAGLNGTTVDPATLRVYMFGPFADTSDLTEALRTKMYESTESYAKYKDDNSEYGDSDYYDSSTGELKNKRGYILANEDGKFLNTEYAAGSVESYSYSLTLPNSVASNKYYIIAVTGIDGDNVKLEPMEKLQYGFKGASSTNPPSISWTATEDRANAKDIANQSVFNTSAMTFTGRAQANSGIKMASVEWTAVVSDEAAGNATKGTITGTATATSGTFGSSDDVFWTFNIADGTGYTDELKAESGSNKLYLYDITIKAIDGNNAKSAIAEKYVHIDTLPPNVSITKVTPDPVAYNGDNCVNGSITVSGGIVETNLSSVKYTVYSNGSPVTGLVDVSLGSVYSFTPKIKTTALTDLKSMNVVVTAVDKAGNSGSYDTTALYTKALVVNQATDVPTVSFSNANDAIASVADIKKAVTDKKDITNLFGITSNNKLFATISDDDNVKSIVIKSRKTNSGTEYTNDVFSNSNLSTPTYALTVPLTSLSEGAYDLQIVVTDSDGTFSTSTITKTFTIAVDSGGPVFSNVALSSGTYYSASGTIKVTGTATDASGTVTLKAVHDGTSTYSVEDSVTNGSPWTDTVTAKPTGDKTHVITYTATDAYGQTSSTSVSYILDTTAPVFVSTGDTVFTVGGKSYSADSWYNDTTLSFTGYYNEANIGSGISKIYYWMNTTPASTTNPDVTTATNKNSAVGPNASNGDACKFSTTISGFNSNSSANYLYIAAVDSVGNISAASGPFSVKVDGTAPSFEPDSTATVLSNATKEITFTGKVVDTGTASGVNTGSITATLGTIAYTATNPATYKLTLSAANLATLKQGINVINATALDNAGNAHTESIATVNIDVTAPTVTYLTPLKDAVVNKTITISGRASDTSQLDTGTSKGTLYVQKNSETARQYAVDIASDGAWSYSLNTFTDDYFNSATTGSMTIWLVVKDAAGNSSATTNTRTFSVDQNTDRPLFNVTNVTANKGVMKYDRVISGTISDDDEITSACVLKVYEVIGTQITVPTTSSAWNNYVQTGTFSFSTSTGDWSYESINSTDGTKTLYLYFKDAGGTEFWTNYSATGNTEAQNKLFMPKVEFKRAASTLIDTEALVYKTDNASPVIETAMLEFSANKTDWETAAFTTNGVVGGSERRYVRMTFTAADDNGIKKMTLTVKDKANASMNATITGTPSTDSTVTTWTSGVIDLGGANSTTYTSGTVSVTAGVVDQSELDGNGTYNFTLDNIAPNTDELTISTPGTETVGGKKISSETYTGLEIALSGIASDTGGAGIKATTGVQWLVPTSTQAAESDAALATDTSWGGKLAANSTSTAWKFVFNGEPDKDNGNDSLKKYSDLQTTTYSGTISVTDNVYSIPVYLKLTDVVGNVSVYRDFIIKFNPYAGWPTAKILYPATGATVGGGIRVNGSATDSNGTPTAVYLQIDLDNDGNYTDADKNALATAGYTISSLADIGVANSSINTVLTADWWGIKVDDASSWSKTLNTKNELNPTGGATSRGLKMRAIAVDNDNNAGIWSNVVELTIDTGAPTIGASVQAVTQTSASKEYDTTSTNYISGKWYLTVSVEDNEQIVDYSVAETIGSQTATTLIAGTGYTVSGQQTYTTYQDGTTHDATHGYTLSIPINNSTEGKVSYYIYANDNSSPTKSGNSTYTFFIDSTAPAFDATYGIAGNGTKLVDKTTPVQNSNGAFALSTKVKDEGSGFDKLAFYYYRNGTKTGVDQIYDPLASNTSVTVYTSAANKSSNTLASGLARETVGTNYLYGLDGSSNGTRPSTTEFKHSGIVGNARIHVGGMIKIGGVYRRIAAVDTTNGIVSFAPAVETSYTAAFIPYVQVIDDTYSESITVENDGTFTLVDPDSDGMYEKVTTTDGQNWTLTGTTNASFIPDGNITIVCVAFDAAGNMSSTSLTTQVQNNPLKLAKLYLATDFNGNGTYDDSEYEVYARAAEGSSGLAATSAWNLETKAHASLDDANNIIANSRNRFIVKNSTNALAVIPETTGGNNITTTTPLNYIFGDGTLTAAKTGSTTALSTITYKSSSLYGLKLGGSSFTSGDTLTSTVRSAASSGHTVNLTFYDNTDETTPGDTTNPSLAAYVNVTLDIDLLDDFAPRSAINPFSWTSVTKNSIYNAASAKKVSDLEGHIDLEADLPESFLATGATDNEKDRDPKVSGKIVVNGTAYDDQRLTALYMTIDGFTFTGAAGSSTTFGFNANGAKTTASSGATYYKVATCSAGVWTGTDKWSAAGWKFTVTPVYFDQRGQYVTWELDWDSSKISDIAGLNKVIRIVAEDARSVANASSETAATADSDVAKYNKPLYQIDVVPYISTVTTELSPLYKSDPSVYSRSVRGHYPVHENEGITLVGFNIGTSATAKLNGTALAAGTGTAGLSWNIGKTATSGQLVVTQGTASTLNNLNADPTVTEESDGTQDVASAVSYNSRANGLNNNLLNDDVYFDVWQFKNAAEPKNGKIQNVTMKVSPKGRIGFSFSNAVVYFSAPSIRYGDTYDPDYVYSQTAVAQNYGWFTNNSFCFDPYGYPYSCAQSPDTDTVTGAAFMQLFSRQTGNYVNSMTLNENYNKIANSSRLEAIDIPINAALDSWTTDIDRTQSIAMAATMTTPTTAPTNTTNEVTLHIAYYDHMTKQIRYRQGLVGTAASDFGLTGEYNSRKNHGGSLVDVGYCSSYWTRQDSRIINIKDSFTYNTYGAQRIYRVAGTNLGTAYATPYQVDTTHKGGSYVDIGIVSSTAKNTNPTVVLCWYDAVNKNLVMSYDTPKSTDAVSTDGMTVGNWSTNATTISEDGGMYCRMAIDANDGIHIAHYTNTGADLLYTYVPCSNGVPQMTKAVTVMVDSFLSVGTNCTIDVAKVGSNYVPYIGYYVPSNQDTSACARIAYPIKFSSNYPAGAGTNAKDLYTGNWEIVTVPTSNTPIMDRINVGLYKVNGVLTAIPAVSNPKIAANADMVNSAYTATRTGETNTFPVSDSTIMYGNGTMNPAVAYAVDEDGVLELAQMK